MMKKSPTPRAVIAERKITEMEQNGTLKYVHRLMGAAFTLSQVADTLFFEAQDVLTENGVIRHEFKQSWTRLEKARDTVQTQFTAAFVDDPSKITEVYTNVFRPIMRVMGLADITNQIAPEEEAPPRQLPEDLGKTVAVTCRMPEVVANLLNEVATSHGYTRSRLLAELGQRYVELEPTINQRRKEAGNE